MSNEDLGSRPASVGQVLHDAGQQHQVGIAGVLHAVAVAGEGGGGVAGGDVVGPVVILEAAVALQEVEKLRLSFVHMVADGGAGDQCEYGKHPAAAGRLGGEVGELHVLLAAAHVFSNAVGLLVLACDHGVNPPCTSVLCKLLIF